MGGEGWRVEGTCFLSKTRHPMTQFRKALKNPLQTLHEIESLGNQINLHPISSFVNRIEHNVFFNKTVQNRHI